MQNNFAVHDLLGTDPLLDAEYLHYIGDLIESPAVQSMKKITQHENSNCLKHSLYVSYNSYLICKKLGLDSRSAARGGLLHDFFLYDRREGEQHKRHFVMHPRAALRNAEKMFALNDVERDIIRKHMFPVTITPPKFKESYVVMCVDKYCACMERFNLSKRPKIRHLLRYLPV